MARLWPNMDSIAVRNFLFMKQYVIGLEQHEMYLEMGHFCTVCAAATFLNK